MKLPIPCIAVGAVFIATAAASAQTLVGMAFRNPALSGNTYMYDVDPTSGTSSNPRQTNATVLCGIAVSASGEYFSMTDQFARIDGVRQRSMLVRVDPLTAHVSVIGPIGATVAEGDLAFQPSTGQLFVSISNSGVCTLYRVDTSTGAGTLVGTLPGSDVSAIAFNSMGELYALDNSNLASPPPAVLYKIDPTNAGVLATVTTNRAIGTTAGMAFSPRGGTLYVADGDFNGTNTFYTLDTTTGQFTNVGTLGLPGQFGGLAGLSFTPTPPCVADVDDGTGTGTPDEGVTIDDLLYYLFIFEAGSIAADVDNGSFTGTPDGGVTIDDLLYFLFRFESGC